VDDAAPVAGTDDQAGSTSDARSDLDRIVASARRLGVELDDVEALQWLTAVALARESSDVVVDMGSGVFGHVVTMLDFSPDDLAYFRKVGELVELHDEEDVETALALSGSAAQSKVQTYPGDCDYFERVNIKAATREAACARLGEVMRAKALDATEGDTYRLVEVKMGSHPTDMVVDGDLRPAGSPISWSPAAVERGRLVGESPDGEPLEVGWDEAAQDPGWCKLDWVVADPVRRQVANASNMLDVTWEAPDGTLTPLDGYLDPYFQEVYLEADSVPLFSKVVSQLSSDALDTYVTALEGEVHKYVAGDSPNFGKAAKRMYNIFRLNGRYEEAAYLRELFDEPTAVLYQVAAVVGTLDEAAAPGSTMDPTTMLAQLDELILAVVETLDGEVELEIVRNLLRLRAAITDGVVGGVRVPGYSDDAGGRIEDVVAAGDDQPVPGDAATAARAHLAEIVNEFFLEKLTGLPGIADYMASLSASDH
jgi:hypothetical protein